MSRPIGVQPVCITGVGGVGGDLVPQHICLDGASPAAPTPGNLYSANFTWSGATVGDEIIIYDDASAIGAINTATAKKLLVFRVPTTAGFMPFNLPAFGKRAYKGMYLIPALAGGAFNLDFGISNGGG